MNRFINKECTLWYRSYEVLSGVIPFSQQTRDAIDIWAFGCILAELIRGKPIFPGRSRESMMHLITMMLGMHGIQINL